MASDGGEEINILTIEIGAYTTDKETEYTTVNSPTYASSAPQATTGKQRIYVVPRTRNCS